MITEQVPPDGPEQAPPRGTSPRKEKRFRSCPFWWLAGLVIVLLGVALGYREVASPDIGFHLNSARWIAENRAFLRQETFVWPLFGSPYYDMQWLFQLLAWACFEMTGTLGLVLLCTFLTLATAASLCVRAAARIRPALAPVLVGLPIFFLGLEWETRPQLLSWLWLSAVLLVLDLAERRGGRFAWFLPPIMVLWANSHSLFILGLVAIGAYAPGRLFGAVNGQGSRQLLAWGVPCGIAAAACLLTPFGWDGLKFPFLQFGYIGSDSVFARGIAEFQSPFAIRAYLVDGRLAFLGPELFWHLMTVFILAGYALGYRHLRFSDWLLLVLFGYIFSLANKNFGYFVVACLPAAAVGWSGAFGTLSKLKRWALLLPLALASVCLVLAGLVLSGWWYAASWSPHRVGHGWNRDVLPVGAAEVLSGVPKSVRNLVPLDFGGYVAFAAQTPVYIDGRLEVVGPAHYERYLKAKDGRGALAELRAVQPDWVLVQHAHTSAWHRYLAGQAGWRMVYADEWSTLYFWRDFAPQVSAHSLDYRPSEDIPGAGTPEVMSWLREAAERPRAGLWGAVAGANVFPVEFVRRSAAGLLTGEKIIARGWCLDGLRQARRFYPDLWANAVLAFAATGEREAADFCLLELRRRGERSLADGLARDLAPSR